MSSDPRREPADPSPRGARTEEPPGLVDAARVEECRRAPEDGPAIVFFSGGTALRGLTRALKRLTHNSTHLITPFDSGGSSAPLRAAFAMPAVGDLRNRLLALADEDAPDASRLQGLFGHRLPRHASPEILRSRLDDLIAGRGTRMDGVPSEARLFAQRGLARFAEAMPEDFDLRGASVGNLVLTGCYLEERRLDGALERLGELLGARGRVLPTADVDLHLEAVLADGTTVRGQHRITGKEHPPPPSPIADVRLVEGLAEGDRTAKLPAASRRVCDLLRSADLVCFPMGSFYSSVLCNLLPRGIGRAVRDAAGPKLYVPSTGYDPELSGIDPAHATLRLLAALRRDAGEETPAQALLGGVLLDERLGVYRAPPDLSLLDEAGVVYRTAPLVLPGRDGIDSHRLAEILVSAAANPAAWKRTP